MTERSPFRLDGLGALVTGASRGIGEAIARRFAEAGASVLLVNRDPVAGERVAGSIRARGASAHAHAADVGTRAGCESAVAVALERLGRLDIVVHNAAACPWSTIESLDDEILSRTLSLNLSACFHLTRAALPAMRRAGEGRILVTSSVTGPRVAMPGSAHYAASKAGVNGFVRSAALELAPERITVNAVEPGYIAKEGGSLLSDPTRAERIARYIPAGELGRPDDVAFAMLYLASPAARYVTGRTIVVDGGSTLPESPVFVDERGPG